MPALLAASLLALAAAAVWAAEDEAHRGHALDVVAIDALDLRGPYDKIWEPFIARWTDEHYIAAYGLQVRGKLDMGDIVCSLSLDGGKSWSPRITVFDHRVRNGSVQYAYNNSVLFRPPDQDVVWLFAMRAPMHYRDSENADLVAAYSADGGYSWQHVELAMGYQGSLIIVAGIETVERDGVRRYLLPAHRNSLRHDLYGDRRQFVLESKSLLRWDPRRLRPIRGRRSGVPARGQDRSRRRRRARDGDADGHHGPRASARPPLGLLDSQ